MYAVIFKATVKQLDDEYSQTAKRMRELAIEKYGCLDFVSSLVLQPRYIDGYSESESG